MKGFKTITILLISIFAVGMLFTACEKDKSEENTPVDITLVADKTNVNPFEIISITATGYSFIEDEYSGTIAGQELSLKKSDQDQLVFMMPSIGNGEQVLLIKINDKDYELKFIVTALAIVENPDEVIAEHKQFIVNMLDTIAHFNASSDLHIPVEQIQNIQNYINDFNQAYASATEVEKQELAQFMQVHSELFDFSHFNFSIFNDGLEKGMKDPDYLDLRLKRDQIYYVLIFAATLKTAVIFNGALSTGNPYFIGISGAALIITAAVTVDQTITIANRIYIPNELQLDNADKTKTIIEFTDDEEYILGIDAIHRSLYNNDVSSSSVIIELVANINTFTHTWNSVASHFPSVDLTIPNIGEQDSYYVTEGRHIVSPQFITIKKTSNSNVQLINNSDNTHVEVKFKTNETTDQDFTFEIVYNNPAFPIQTIPYSAKVKLKQPFSIEILSGNNQSGELGEMLEEPIEVLVKDEEGNPFESALITFEVSEGTVSFDQTTTNADGIAFTYWSLGTNNDEQELIAKAFESDGVTAVAGSPLVFSAEELEFVYEGVWLRRWINADGTIYQDDRITFDANGESTLYEYNINNGGWVVNEDTMTLQYSNGQLSTLDHYWGLRLYFIVNSVDDNVFYGVPDQTSWDLELHRQ